MNRRCTFSFKTLLALVTLCGVFRAPPIDAGRLLNSNKFMHTSDMDDNYNKPNDGLLLATADTIAFVYPKEMSYEKDFMHMVFKLTPASRATYRIDDAVFDNRTCSLYFVVSNLATGGSDLIMLSKNHHNTQQQQQLASSEDDDHDDNFQYEMDANWSHRLVYANRTAKLLSMDIDVHARRLYMLEFSVATSKKYSLVQLKLAPPSPPPPQPYGHHQRPTATRRPYQPRVTRFTFHSLDARYFGNDGYLCIAVVRDMRTSSSPSTTRQHQHTSNNNNNNDSKHTNDITFFVSNNQTLNICFTVNMTCGDYFRHPTQPSVVEEPLSGSTSVTGSTAPQANNDYNDLDDLDDEEVDIDDQDDQDANESNNQTSATLSSTVAPAAALVEYTEAPYKFGRLMSVRYEASEHALYLNDFDYDVIYKMTFARLLQQHESFSVQFERMDILLRTDYANNQSPLNVIMSFMYDSHIYWIDFEDGLKTVVHKSSCVRTIYKAKEPVALRFIQQLPAATGSSSSSKHRTADDRLAADPRSIVQLDSLQRFKYPPGFDAYKLNGEDAAELMDDGRAAAKLALASSADHSSIQSDSHASRHHRPPSYHAYILLVVHTLLPLVFLLH